MREETVQIEESNFLVLEQLPNELSSCIKFKRNGTIGGHRVPIRFRLEQAVLPMPIQVQVLAADVMLCSGGTVEV